jgi:D-threonate/D-erythronate kinase
VVAPAFPAEARMTVGGVQRVGGRAVHRTWFAHDPSHPVRDADLLRLFRGAVLLGLGRGAEVARLVGTVSYIVADAVSDRDLDALVAAIPRPEEVLWVGSPGLAAALARRLAARAPTARGAEECAFGSRVLVAAGSLNPATAGQLARLGSAIGAGSVPVTDPAAVEHAERRLWRQGAVILRGPPGRRDRRVGSGAAGPHHGPPRAGPCV